MTAALRANIFLYLAGNGKRRLGIFLNEALQPAYHRYRRLIVVIRSRNRDLPKTYNYPLGFYADQL